MVQIRVNSNLWNGLCLLILFSILFMLLTVGSPKDDYKPYRRRHIASRDLKYFSSQKTNATNSRYVKREDPDEFKYVNGDRNLPLIYVITPTYYRVTQMAELTRLANTLRQVKRLHWILIEDWTFTNHYIHEFVVSTNISFTYLAQRTRKTTSSLSKGADQRNAALSWIIHHHNWREGGVVYFADDDNSYDLRIFEEMRHTKKLSMWPVGLSGNRQVERPIVINGKVKRFNAWWTEGRVFPVDMAGFAIHVNVLWDYHPMKFETRPEWCCMLETLFLELCCTVDDIEPLADNCTKVYVWHTRTTRPSIYTPPADGDPYV